MRSLQEEALLRCQDGLSPPAPAQPSVLSSVAQKAGGCPYRPQARCFRYEAPECQSDWQCPNNQKCCQDTCGIKCLDPVTLSNPVTKPGQCPAVHGECMMLNPPNHCENDGQCVDNLKCCKGMCGKLCVAPVTAESSKIPHSGLGDHRTPERQELCPEEVTRWTAGSDCGSGANSEIGVCAVDE
ncbi:PREDICTED: antileukoproteinase [Condylura cristata]|uniref:antileukoproteinase n=1 Tax=Condylura cristata TaxID=143302 RepID=UPI000642B3DB|nr:PREDICTED: antileukoproteinase [Condylura cristata]